MRKFSRVQIFYRNMSSQIISMYLSGPFLGPMKKRRHLKTIGMVSKYLRPHWEPEMFYRTRNNSIKATANHLFHKRVQFVPKSIFFDDYFRRRSGAMFNRATIWHPNNFDRHLFIVTLYPNPTSMMFQPVLSLLQTRWFLDEFSGHVRR